MPFLAWNLTATLDGVLFQLRGPVTFRPDSVSLTALVAAFTGLQTPRWLAPMAQSVVGVAAFWRLRDTGVAGLLLASALATTASFLAGYQAFSNYYYFVALMLFAAAQVDRVVVAILDMQADGGLVELAAGVEVGDV